MFCTKCGKQLSENAKFCTGCGNQVEQSDAQQPKMEPPKMQQPQMQQPQMEPPKMQQPKMEAPKMQQPQMQQSMNAQNVPNVQAPNMAFHLQNTQETKQMENKNKRVMIILFTVLIVLVLVAAGMAVYYFTVLKGDSPFGIKKTEEVTEDDSADEDDDVTDEEDNVTGDSETDTSDDAEDELSGTGSDSEQAAEAEEESLSDTNEVVKGTILYNVPKSVYSYDFDDSLGNAQVVTRSAGETMPEIADGIEPQYVSGMDGKAVYLDGTYGIRLSDVQRVGTSYTIAFWMKADALYDWAPFIHIGYNLLDPNQRCRLWLGQKTDGVSVAPILSSELARFQASYEIRPNSTYSSMTPTVWYHIVFTVDGTKQGSGNTSVQGTLYVAGQYAGEGDVVMDAMNVDNLDVYLGINCWDVLYPVAFDSVKIWDQALDAKQVKELFDAY